MATLLMVDDDAVHRRVLRIGLTARGHAVVEAEDGRSARVAVETQRPDLVLLDLGLPDIDGVELCRHLRLWPNAPIIIVSAEGDEHRMVAAFRQGADDYVVKPVAMEVLAARIGVHLRYAEILAQVSDVGVLACGDVRVDTAAHLVEIAGDPVDVRPQQFTILELLLRHEARLVTYEMLGKALARNGEEPDRKAIRIGVHRLRTALGSGPQRPHVVTEHHVGYRLVPPG